MTHLSMRLSSLLTATLLSSCQLPSTDITPGCNVDASYQDLCIPCTRPGEVVEYFDGCKYICTGVGRPDWCEEAGYVTG